MRPSPPLKRAYRLKRPLTIENARTSGNNDYNNGVPYSPRHPLHSGEIYLDFGKDVELLAQVSTNNASSDDMLLALDKDANGTLSKLELREYEDGRLIFIERGTKKHLESIQKAWPLAFLYE
ncbi:uncharacterized protein LOC130733076 [Lotus japonicus]|uniref:uncharacterized protein LOC130733076 n=1 Tax=Lotus japonicus TaxID=34305 RepID=UPI002589B9D4|nr:uncharacterized protein LOC130733076 [Lotus japonicus]XP_057441124.1 uncharacterized protein LOC130733076 [Lotus japonicus]